MHVDRGLRRRGCARRSSGRGARAGRRAQGVQDVRWRRVRALGVREVHAGARSRRRGGRSRTFRAPRARTGATPCSRRPARSAAGPRAPRTTAGRSSTASPRCSRRGARSSRPRSSAAGRAQAPPSARSWRRSDRAVAYAGWADKYQSLFASTNPVSGPHFTFTVPEPMGSSSSRRRRGRRCLGLAAGALLPVITAGNTCVVLASEADPRTALVFGEGARHERSPGRRRQRPHRPARGGAAAPSPRTWTSPRSICTAWTRR